MYSMCKWLAVGLVALTVGCNKAGQEAGDAASVPAKADPNVTPDVAMTTLFSSMSQGDTTAMWNSLPASYQTEVTTVKDQFAAKMDPELWNKTFVVVGKVGSLLKTKKDLILNSSLFADDPEQMKEKVRAEWDSLVKVVETLANSDIKTIDGLKNTSPGQFLSSTGNVIGSQAVKVAKNTNPMVGEELKSVEKMKFTIIKQEGDKVTLRREGPGEPAVDKDFVKVEGKWIPAEMAEEFPAMMKTAKENIAKFELAPEQKGMAIGVLATVEGTLDRLLAAKDQASFDAEVKSVQSMFEMMMPGGGSMSGPGMSGPPGAMSGPPGGLPGGSSLPAPTIVPPTTVPPTTPSTTPK